MSAMLGRPDSTEAAPAYFKYINQVAGDNPLPVIENQLEQCLAFFSKIDEAKSLHRYAPGKWSIRQVLNHVTDTERAMVFRALWFARGFDTPLASFDQEISSAAAEADRISWAEHIEEFRRVRLATIPLFRNLPPQAWTYSGIANNSRITVRALAYVIPGHVTHHVTLLHERYL